VDVNQEAEMQAQPIPINVATYTLWEKAPRPGYTSRLLSLYRASGRPA
jgi:hypothetical protein